MGTMAHPHPAAIAPLYWTIPPDPLPSPIPPWDRRARGRYGAHAATIHPAPRPAPGGRGWLLPFVGKLTAKRPQKSDYCRRGTNRMPTPPHYAHPFTAQNLTKPPETPPTRAGKRGGTVGAPSGLAQRGRPSDLNRGGKCVYNQQLTYILPFIFFSEETLDNPPSLCYAARPHRGPMSP